MAASPHEFDVGISDRPSFLASHRALAVCTREFGKLSDGIVDRVEALAGTGAVEKPVVRAMPGRCIVQLGPVALTIAWLRSTLDSVADGQLLVIVWRGNVAPKMARLPEHMAGRGMSSSVPVALIEETLMAGGNDEASWSWHLAADMKDFTSAELADRCVAHLREAYGSEAAVA